MKDKCKIFLVISLTLLVTVSANMQSKVSYQFFNALNSSFEEYPDPKTGNDKVWGDFGTNFNKFTYEKAILSNLSIDLSYSTSTILRNKMYVRNSMIGTQYGYIGGTNSTYAVNCYFRHWENSKNYSDVFMGYEHKYTLKEFYDKSDLSDIGNYQSTFSSFTFGWRGQWQAAESVFLKAKLYGQPVVHNMTWVIPPVPGSDSASYVTRGNAQYLELGVSIKANEQWEYYLGHIYNSYYFEPVGDNYDLSIGYDGFFLEISYLL